MDNEELLRLYVTDQEERKKLQQINDPYEFEIMKEKVLENDAERRDLVNELMPRSSRGGTVTAQDYYRAAIIMSRGNSNQDRERAQEYARKAEALTQFKQTHFAAEVKNLNERLKKNQSPQNESEMFKDRLVRDRVNRERMIAKDRVVKDSNKLKQINRTEENKKVTALRLKPMGSAIDPMATMQQNKKKDAEQDHERAERPQPKPRCYVCGRQHAGPCPPK